ncbi:S-Ena type endospore appendage [Bacillus mycoides]|uniref:S-Ena type endospore appendage n=1 Tax=Bacillus mycoides TaxID=1405 RepID=UPI003D64A2B7
MSCGCSTNSPCCRPAQLLVDEFCENFNVNATAQQIWLDTSPQDGVYTVSVSPDADASASVTIDLSTGTDITYTLAAGQSRTDVVPNAVSVSIASASATLHTTGKACISIYRKFR